MKVPRPFALTMLCMMPVTLSLSGCWNDEQAKTPESQVVETHLDAKLTPEEARTALIDVKDNGHAGHGMGFEFLFRELKTDQVETLDDGTCRIGRWHCDLVKRRFYGLVHFPGAMRHSSNEWWGVFERSSDGKWRAMITDSRSGG